MSRHHIQPPPIYLAPTPPKPAVRKSKTSSLQQLEESKESSETSEADEGGGVRQTFGQELFDPVDDFDLMKRKNRGHRRLSDAMLKALLALQETDQ